MKRKDRLLLQFLPVTLAAALAAAPVLAQSPGSAGGASGNTAATGADTRSSTGHGTTTSGNTSGTTGSTAGSTTAQGTTGTGTTGTGTTATPGSTMSGSTVTTPSTTVGTTMGMGASSVIMHRPRLSQLIGTNVYNDRNETIGEVDDIILAAPTGMGAASGSHSTPSGSTTGSTTTGTTAPGSAMPSTGTAMAPGATQGPMAVIQVGGFLGMGGRLVAIPLSELQWNTERERIVMPNASKETLQGRPAFSYDALRRG